MTEGFQVRTLKRKNVKGLALNTPPKTASKPSDGDSQIPGAIGNTDRTDTLEIGLEFKLDLRSEDLITLKEVGAGNGGTVSKVMHATTKVIMARKIIRVDAKENVRKQILRELQVCHDCNSPYIVTFYGAFQNEARDIVLCMEYMDCGSLDRISKQFGPIRVDVLGKITEAILGGLVYLYETHRIMHRDIKPSNVLVNSRGQIKLCDFGVAGETVNSIADTFVGTSTYMAPERIQGGQYTVRSDVWSVGLTVMELAVGRFPFDTGDSSAGDRASAGPMGILDLLQQIVHEPAPKLPKSDAFPPILHEFVAKCLLKKPEERPTPRELYDNDAFLQAAKRTPVDLQGWAMSLMEKSNRKSHLAPPAPKALNRDGSRASPKPPPKPPTTSTSRSSQGLQKPAHQAPTSGEIPLNISSDIAGHGSHHNSHSKPPPNPIMMARSPPPPSLEHLSLETRDPHSSDSRRSNHLYPGDPFSTADPPARPTLGPRSSSSHNTSTRSQLQTTLPIRAAPPSNHLQPPPAVSTGGSRGAYPNKVRGDNLI